MLTKEFIVDGNNNLTGLKTINLKSEESSSGKQELIEEKGTEKIWEADLVLLAMGFVGPERYLLEKLQVSLNKKNTINSEHGAFKPNIEGVFTAGDCRRGQSLIVWAMNEGRGAALQIDRYLSGSSVLSAPTLKLGSLKD